MSSFFTLPASQRKRKREDRATAPGSKKRGVAANSAPRESNRQRPSRERDESISGSESEDENDATSAISEDEISSESDRGETAAEKRLKLAERYLENLREEVDEAGFDAAEIDRDLIAERLKEDVDESKGRVFRQIASQLNFADASHAFFRADTQSTTSVAVHDPHLYTVSKDCTLIKWELISPNSKSTRLENGSLNGTKHKSGSLRKKPKQIKFVKSSFNKQRRSNKQGHTGIILTVAVSPSGKYVATGGTDRKLIIWDAETLTPMKTFTHHRDSVSALAFTRHISQNSSGEQLFSASFDRTIKTWSLSLSGHAYVETLFGHQESVASLASMMTDQCVSVGARDRTARLWKVVDESQLVFRGDSSKKAEYQNNSLDCVAVIPPNHFVTGSDAGEISLWSVHKKKPLFTIPHAHGLDPIPPLEELSTELDPAAAAKTAKHLRRTPRWITALATVPGTDIVLSGSWDGWIRAWRVSEDKKMLYHAGPVGGSSDQQSSLTATPSLQLKQTLTFEGIPSSDAMVVDAFENQSQIPQSTFPNDSAEATVKPLIKGVVNDIAVFERRPESSKQGMYLKSSKTSSASAKANGTSSTDVKGLCIVAAIGKEHRFGRLKCFANNFYDGTTAQGRNGAVVFEVEFLDEDDHGAEK